MGKKELQVAAIENGTVIDHIPSEKTYEVARLLHLTDIDVPILIGYNLPSKKIGRKGIIKITNKYFTDEEISRLSVIAPKVVLNIIKDYEVVEKKMVETPNELHGIIKCNNPTPMIKTIHDIELANISRYRGELMGLAMLFIVLFHIRHQAFLYCLKFFF